MAAEDEGKTEQPTSKRLGEEREKGNVPRSMDLTNGAMLMVSVLLLWFFGERLWNGLQQNLIHTFKQIPILVMNDIGFTQLLQNQGFEVIKIIFPILAILMAFGIVINLIQFGWIFSLEQVSPKLSNLFNINAITQMFNIEAFMELLKGLAKMAVIGYFAYSIISSHYIEMVTMTDQDIHNVIGNIFSLSFELMFKIALLMLLIGIVDLIYRKRQYIDKLKMTKQEVKDEYKMTEGDPKIKQRMRQMMMQMARRSMMQEVPKATVVITNPTFIAIALRYERGVDEAPIIVAKGKRLVAQKIRELAAENKIPTVENKPLARSMYDIVEVGEAVPPEFFAAVAEVLAFVFSRETQHAH